MIDCTAWCNPLIQIARDMMISVLGFFWLSCVHRWSPRAAYILSLSCASLYLGGFCESSFYTEEK